jgi:hypothetical protein
MMKSLNQFSSGYRMVEAALYHSSKAGNLNHEEGQVLEG